MGLHSHVGEMMMMERIDPSFPETYYIGSWYKMRDDKRLKVVREIVDRYGRDPRISDLAVSILKAAGVKPRDYVGQAAALLKWVQTNIYYVNEPAERLQAPLATIRMGYGDCDDMVILFMALAHSIHLPTKLVIAGKKKNDATLRRHIEGQKLPRGVNWTHIYCMVGDNPFTPKRWYFCEPTMAVPLGWDAVDHLNANQGKASSLPELAGTNFGASPVAAVMGATVGSVTSNILPAVLIGSVTAVLTELLIEYARTTDLYLDWKEGIDERRDQKKSRG
jgi:hypothetical protein